MKILVTGATGFLGRAFCRLAVERGHRVLALCRHADAGLPCDVEVITGSLAETPWQTVEKFKPDAALHLAWIATPGVYLTSLENEVWLEQSKDWFRQLRLRGVRHIVGTGTCIEYAASEEPLNEATSRLDPVFPYSKAKAALYEWLRKEDRGGDLWTWFRVFYAYGPGEHPNRVCSSLVDQLRRGRGLELRTPHSIKDYIYIDDVSSAMCLAIEAGAKGAINLGTGQGISIKSLAIRIAQILGVDPSFVKHAVQLAEDPTPVVVADNSRLVSLGWTRGTELDHGLQALVDSLKGAY